MNGAQSLVRTLLALALPVLPHGALTLEKVGAAVAGPGRKFICLSGDGHAGAACDCGGVLTG